ncbi:Alpha amylase, catalytic domain containing protein, putative, partial [Eimeria maxima]
EPRLAVTFIENHDTDHLDYCRTFCNGELNGVLQGYAVILTHPGIPCIYWNHFSDYGDYCRQKLQELCDVRTSMGIHSTSGLYIDRAERGLYTACITPKDSSCQPQTARVAVKRLGFASPFFYLSLDFFLEPKSRGVMERRWSGPRKFKKKSPLFPGCRTNKPDIKN